MTHPVHRSEAEIDAEILRQTEAQGPGRSISPNDVARALAPESEAWQRLLGPVRNAAQRLAREGRVEVLRKGKPVTDPSEMRGVIRLRAPATPPSTP